MSNLDIVLPLEKAETLLVLDWLKAQRAADVRNLAAWLRARAGLAYTVTELADRLDAMLKLEA